MVAALHGVTMMSQNRVFIDVKLLHAHVAKVVLRRALIVVRVGDVTVNHQPVGSQLFNRAILVM